jgi:hypothetical protein
MHDIFKYYSVLPPASDTEKVVRFVELAIRNKLNFDGAPTENGKYEMHAHISNEHDAIMFTLSVPS